MEPEENPAPTAGGSLFDVEEASDSGDDEPAAEVKDEKKEEPRKDVDPNEGGSLFDI